MSRLKIQSVLESEIAKCVESVIRSVRPHAFREPRLRYYVNSIVPFSRDSVSESIGTLWRDRDPFGAEEEIYALTFLQFLNVTTDRFSLIDPYFTRGTAPVTPEFVLELAHELISQLSIDARLAGAAVTSSLRSDEMLPALERIMARMHSVHLSRAEYEQLEGVQNLLALSLLLPYLPRYVRDDLEKMRRLLDKEVETHLGPGITRRDLQAMAIAVETLRRDRGRKWVRPQPDVQTKYRRLILTPQDLFERDLEDLYIFPPFLIAGPNEEYATIVPEQTFLWLRLKELRFLEQVRQRHSNVTGDTVEILLKEYLETKQLVPDTWLPDGMVGRVQPHPHHFEKVYARKRFARNSRQDIFGVLRNPLQPTLELDLVATHTEGFSILGEVKFVTSYEKAEEYYYQGSDDKEPERDRLLKLAGFLNRHPDRKAAFLLPNSRPVIPVFVTNAVGKLFADSDGIIKACPLEVMLVEPFYLLLKARLDEVTHSALDGPAPS